MSSSPATKKSPGHRHRSHWWAATSIAAVVLAIVTLVVIAAGSGSPPLSTPRIGSGVPSNSGADPAPAAVQAAVSSVDPRTFRTVGAPTGLVGPSRINGSRPVLVGADGKPQILFVGAEYCPYCAAERWALVVALSRFGSFGGLKSTHSSSTDVYPETQTLSFYGSRYSSPRLDFSSVELTTNQAVAGRYRTLQRLTPDEQSVLDTYDRAPYTSQPGAIPFIDVANRFVMIGASYDPAVLQGKSIAQIATSLSHPSSPIAQAIDGTANLLVSAISAATGVQPNM